MFVVIGIVIVMGSVLLGYLMHHGNIGVLMQINEFIILFGAGFGSFLAANGMKNVQASIKAITGLFKPDPYTKPAYNDLLKMMYQLFNVARKEGLLGLEKHIEEPDKSEIISEVPYLCEQSPRLRVPLRHDEGHPHRSGRSARPLRNDGARPGDRPPGGENAGGGVQTVGDAMPGFGIVAAVLGVIITMGEIGGEAASIGKSVAAALVGTFLGILFAYGVFAPLARAIELRLKSEEQYLNCIRFALFSFARGESPITCVEFARRNIEPTVRPGFAEMEKTVKEKAA